MQLISILATSNNGIIGINHKEKNKFTIPWAIPSDMKHFKSITQNNILIMGSKTYGSLPQIFFKDHSRKIILLTRNKYMISHKKNTFIAHSKDHAMKIACNLANKSKKDLIICGGKEIYNLFMLDVTKWIVSHVNTTIHTTQSHETLVNISDILTHITHKNRKITEIHKHIQKENDQYDFKILSYEF